MDEPPIKLYRILRVKKIQGQSVTTVAGLVIYTEATKHKLDALILEEQSAGQVCFLDEFYSL